MDSAPDAALDVYDVAKVYRRRVHALKGISLRVMQGEVFGLLGPNGAGKSTLVKILMTIVRPDRAGGMMLGHPIGDRAALGRVGYLPENLRFPDYLTAAQALDFYAALARVPRNVRSKRCLDLLTLVGMKDWADVRIRNYSKGMRQRVGLAQALVNDPDLVVLDEPTDGVDPVGRHEIRQILLQLRDQGKTVLVNSHLLGELEMVCDRFAILNRGDVVHQGTLSDLGQHCERYEIDLATPLPADGPLRETLRALQANIQGGELGTRILLSGGPVEVQPLIDALRAAEVTIEAVRPIRQSLEAFFIDAVKQPAVSESVNQVDSQLPNPR